MKFPSLLKFKRAKVTQENCPLIAPSDSLPANASKTVSPRRKALSVLLSFAAILAFWMFGVQVFDHWHESRLPKDPHEAAKVILNGAPVIVSVAVVAPELKISSGVVTGWTYW